MCVSDECVLVMSVLFIRLLLVYGITQRVHETVPVDQGGAWRG